MPAVFFRYSRICLGVAIVAVLSLSSGESWSKARGNILLRGLVTYQSSNSTPIEGVEISSFGANTTYTNSAGLFELAFDAKAAGDKVTLVIHKAGLVLLNSREVDRVFIPANPDELIRLVMVRPEERNALMIQFYDIIVENTNAEFQAAFDEINTKLHSLERNQLEERQELIARTRRLEQERDKQFERAEALSQRLSNVDLDQASDLAKAAFAEFQAGNIKEAIAILDDKLLSETLRSAREAKRRAGERLQAAERAISESVENYMIKARFSIADQDFQQADRNFSKGVEADLTNYANVDEYLIYLWGQLRFDQALELGRRALQWTSAGKDRADLLYWLGINGHRTSQNQIALSSLEQALEEYLQLEEDSQGLFTKDIGKVYNALGTIYSSAYRFEDAIDFYQRSLKHKESLGDDSGTAITLYNLSNLYHERRELNVALKLNERAISIQRKLIADNPDDWSIRENMARILRSAASIRREQSELEKARSHINEALSIVNKIAEERGDSYRLMIAFVLQEKGAIEVAASDLEAARMVYEEGLSIYREHIKESPQSVGPQLAIILSDLGHLYIKVGNVDEALRHFVEALEIEQSAKYADPYRTALVLYSIGKAYRLQHKRGEMFAHYSKALEIVRRLAEKDAVYGPVVAEILTDLAKGYYIPNGDTLPALAHFLEAHDIYEALWRKNSALYVSALCWSKLPIVKVYTRLLVDEADQAHLENGMRIVSGMKKLEGESSFDDTLADCTSVADILQTALEKDPLEYLKGTVARDAAAALRADDSKKVDAKARYRDAISYYEEAIRKTGKLAYKATLASTYLELNELEESPATKAEILGEVVKLRREVHREENDDRWAGIQLARALTSRGSIKLDDAAEEAGRDFAEAIRLYEGLAGEGELDERLLLELAYVYQLLTETEPDFGNRIENQSRLVDIVASILPMSESDPEGDQQMVSHLAKMYGTLSFYKLFAGRFNEAEEDALKGLELDPAQDWIKTNLGHSYLLRGQYGMAVSAYQELKGKTDGDRPYKEILIEDFELLSTNGITHADVRQARDMIEAW